MVFSSGISIDYAIIFDRARRPESEPPGTGKIAQKTGPGQRQNCAKKLAQTRSLIYPAGRIPARKRKRKMVRFEQRTQSSKNAPRLCRLSSADLVRRGRADRAHANVS